jgi:hypothetical protein
MKLYSQDGSELMLVESLDRDGNDLIIMGKVFGPMPMSARLKPEEARRGLTLLSLRITTFLLTLLFRK